MHQTLNLKKYTEHANADWILNPIHSWMLTSNWTKAVHDNKWWNNLLLKSNVEETQFIHASRITDLEEPDHHIRGMAMSLSNLPHILNLMKTQIDKLDMGAHLNRHHFKSPTLMITTILK